VKILAVDVGGSHIKVLASGQPRSAARSTESGPALGPAELVRSVRELAEGWSFEAISIGFPGPVRDSRPAREPWNLGTGWVDYDFASTFGCPTQVVNDAAMQALGSYAGRSMLFLGLGTGLGSALVFADALIALELAHLPYRKGRSYEDYLGEQGLERRGKHKWSRSVEDVAQRFLAAFLVEEIVLGGGNVRLLETLPEGCRRGDNADAFDGGFRLWERCAD
jgi:polyphosphate glucokinase